MKPAFIDHLVLIVREIKESEQFYSAFLGKPDHLGEDSVSYKVGETKIFLGLPYGEFQKVDVAGLYFFLN